MGLTTTSAFTITCDNPACPGNDLDPSSYEGWIKLVAQVTPPVPEGLPEGTYTFPIMQEAYYCSSACAGTVGAALDAAADARKPPPEIENTLPEEEAAATKRPSRTKKS